MNMTPESNSSQRTPASPCVFIVGYGRSGTTLFRRMLAAHPNIFIPPENDIFQRIPAMTGSVVKTQAVLDKTFAALPPYYDDIYDMERLKAAVSKRLPLPLPELFVMFFDHARIGLEKSEAVWGHKMPSEWPFIPTWKRWFPNSRFIHMVRNPLSATASMVKHQLQRYPTTPLVAGWQWRKMHRAIAHHGAQVGPQRYLQVRYEDLVQAPHDNLTRVCRFLEVSDAHVDKMVNYTTDTTTSRFVDEGVHMKRSEQPLKQDRVGHSDYSDSQKAVIQYLCQKELAHLEQTTEPAALSLVQKAYLSTAAKGLDVAWGGLRLSRVLRGQL